MTEAPPAFLLYVKDFLSDDAVSLMTNEQIGAYVLLLCHQWKRPDGLPAAMASLAKLARCTPARFTRVIWPGLAEKFPANESGRLANPKLERVRAEMIAYREGRSEAGRRGAARRWHSHRSGNGSANGVANGSANAQPIANRWPSSASASTPPNPPHGGRSPEARPETLEPTAMDDVTTFLEGFRERYRRIVGGSLPLVWSHKDVTIARELLQTWPLARLLDMAEIFLWRDDREVAGKPKSLAWFRVYATWCDGQLAKAAVS